MQKDIEEIKVDIAEIKKDLKYHIKRTDILEKMVTPAYHFTIFLKISVIIITTIAAIMAIF